MKRGLTALAAGLALAACSPAAIAATTIHTIDAPTAFPEGLAAAPDGTFYTGSVVDGAIYRGRLEDPALTEVSAAGADGRAAAAGMELDRRGRLWVAGAGTGKLFVYDTAPFALRHVFELAKPQSGTVNDLAIVGGQAYVTDSSRPRLWRVPLSAANRPGTTPVRPWLRVMPPVRYRDGDGTDGVNLNGIGATPSGRALVVVQTNAGRLWRIDVARGRVTPVVLRGGDLRFGDGLITTGPTAFVAQNATAQITRLRLTRDGRAATVTSVTRDPSFAFPTAIGLTSGRLLVPNAQLDKAGGTPDLPFAVSELPVPKG